MKSVRLSQVLALGDYIATRNYHVEEKNNYDIIRKELIAPLGFD